MLKFSWQEELCQTLQYLEREIGRAPRVCMIGTGSERRGDDIAGLDVARGLLHCLCEHPDTPFMVIDAGAQPENHLDKIREFDPDFILMVDSADFHAEPGKVSWVSWETGRGFDAAPHTPRTVTFARYLHEEVSCPVALIAIQPERVNYNHPLSKPVWLAVDQVVHGIEKAVRPIVSA